MWYYEKTIICIIIYNNIYFYWLSYLLHVQFLIFLATPYKKLFLKTYVLIYVQFFCVFFFNQALQSSLQEHQADMNYLSKTAEELSSKAPADVKQKYWAEIDQAQSRWQFLSSQIAGKSQKLEELLNKHRQFQVCLLWFLDIYPISY